MFSIDDTQRISQGAFAGKVFTSSTRGYGVNTRISQFGSFRTCSIFCFLPQKHVVLFRCMREHGMFFEGFGAGGSDVFMTSSRRRVLHRN